MNPYPIAAQVIGERKRQEEIWGKQRHPNGTGAQYGYEAVKAQEACSVAAKAGSVTWKDILHEEVCEAFAEADPVRLRHELVQVAAVAVNWIEALDRQRKG